MGLHCVCVRTRAYVHTLGKRNVTRALSLLLAVELVERLVGVEVTPPRVVFGRRLHGMVYLLVCERFLRLAVGILRMVLLKHSTPPLSPEVSLWVGTDASTMNSEMMPPSIVVTCTGSSVLVEHHVVQSSFR